MKELAAVMKMKSCDCLERKEGEGVDRENYYFR